MFFKMYFAGSMWPRYLDPSWFTGAEMPSSTQALMSKPRCVSGRALMMRKPAWCIASFLAADSSRSFHLIPGKMPFMPHGKPTYTLGPVDVIKDLRGASNELEDKNWWLLLTIQVIVARSGWNIWCCACSSSSPCLAWCSLVNSHQPNVQEPRNI